jgi:hypothetical protein
VQRVEPIEVERGIGAQLSLHPETHFSDLRHVIVLCGDQEICDLQVNGLLLDRLQSLKNRGKLAATEIRIKTLRKALKVHLGRIQYLSQVSEILTAGTGSKLDTKNKIFFIRNQSFTIEF